jgi:uncharacterized protein YcnI
MRTKLIALAVIGFLSHASAAAGHVTVQPTTATPGSFARFVVRVPTELDAAATVKVEVQLPEGLEPVSFQPKAGWARTVAGRTVTWEGGRIEPHEFGFSARMPERPTTLVFPAVQTYSNGEVVRWVGPADADEPAGRVTVAAKAADDGGKADDTDRGTVLGALGTALGALALVFAVVTRRRSTP